MLKTIEKIHRKFDTAGEKILAEAKRIIAESGGKDKTVRLVNLGFRESKPVKDSKELRKSQQLVRLIEEYSITYPNYKFVTEEVVNKICKKYGLLFSAAHNYIGDIPEKNILEIEAFVKMYNIVIDTPLSLIDGMLQFTLTWSGAVAADSEGVFKEPTIKEFKIVAPEKDFNTIGKVKKGYELIDDPIVLYPVKGGYLVISKWGLEANDESLINEKQN